MPQRMFRMNTCTLAILDENNRPSVVSIPANAVVTLMVGDPDGNGFGQSPVRGKDPLDVRGGSSFAG
jgi:hypothetical protein